MGSFCILSVLSVVYACRSCNLRYLHLSLVSNSSSIIMDLTFLTAAYYWVSWERDVIEFGLGATVGYESYLKWDASDHQYLHPVNAISVMSFKTGGTWEFSQIEGEFHLVITCMLSFLLKWLNTIKHIVKFPR